MDTYNKMTFNPYKWRWMVNAIGALRGLFLCLNELFPKNPFLILIIFPLKYLDNFRTKRRQRLIQQILLLKDFVATRVCYEVRQLESRNIVRFGLDLELLACEYVMKSFWIHVISAVAPKPGKRLL